VILVDTSVLVRLTVPEVAEVLYPLLESGAVATCGVIDLELLSRITVPATLAAVAWVRSASFHWLVTWDTDLQAAVQMQQDMVKAGLAAACWPSQVIAAVARRHGVPVLHHDRCFDRIAKVTGQGTRWVVPDVDAIGVDHGPVRRDACDRSAD
jgi:predicted nucleic acid-binding protein